MVSLQDNVDVIWKGLTALYMLYILLEHHGRGSGVAGSA